MKVVAESAPKTAKWWQKVPALLKCGGTKRWNKKHHISNCGGTLTTTYHISGAGAPAKTKKYKRLWRLYFFGERVRPFPHLAKPVNTTFRKDRKANGTDKKEIG